MISNVNPSNDSNIKSSSKPAISMVFATAMGVDETYYSQFVDFCRTNEFPLTFVEITSKSEQENQKSSLIGYGQYVDHLIPKAILRMQTDFSEKQCIVVGHSLGGQLGLIASGRHFSKTPIVLIASGNAYFNHFPRYRAVAYLVGSQFIRVVSRLLGYWPGNILGFGGKQTQALIEDWAGNVRTGNYAPEFEISLNKFSAELLSINIEGDLLCTTASTQSLIDMTSSTFVKRNTYISKFQKRKPGKHFSWAKDFPGVIPIIHSWILEL